MARVPEAECAAAFADDFGEEALRGWGGHEGADGEGAGGFAEDGDVAGVAAEFGDVLLDPLEGCDHVHEAVVAGCCRLVRWRVREVARKPKTPRR